MNLNQTDLICSYSRKQAIEDGLQVCVSEQFPNDTRMYKFPVYFTTEVWQLCQGKEVIVWDICYMAAITGKNQNDSIIEFNVIVLNAQRTPDFLEDNVPCYTLWAECSCQDFNDPSPAITIMFPEER